MQCHEEAAFCWCVTPMGKTIPNTSVAHALPKCPPRGKSKKQGRNNSRNQRRNCDAGDRAQFVNNLVYFFSTEYNRDISQNSNFSKENPSSKENLKQEAVKWKFSVLDVDRSKNLSKAEFRNLRRLVKKVVKPKRCAKSFIPLCDENKDAFITEIEWIKCLSFGHETNKKDDGGKESSASPAKEVKKETPEVDQFEEDSHALGSMDAEEDLLPYEGGIDGDSDDSKLPIESVPEADPMEASGCLYDRQTALDELQFRPTPNYVPECTPDGRYEKVQCFKSKGYCWCAHEDTGKTIPGSARYNQRPSCDTLQSPPRPMKGCPEAKKVLFSQDLTRIFKETLSNYKSSNGSEVTWALGNEEQILTSYFQYLDESKNKFLERKEWKPFRTMMTGNKLLQRCGRRLNKYCDVNQDNRISLTEWLACLKIVQMNPQQGMSTIIPPHNLKGPNPLDKYLKDN